MTAISTDPINSSVAMMGFPNPAVAAELFNRSNDVEAWTTPAVLPAPTIAIVYCSHGGIASTPFAELEKYAESRKIPTRSATGNDSPASASRRASKA